MTIKISLVTILMISLSFMSRAQIDGQLDILEASKKYYKSLNLFFVGVKEKTKSSIAEVTHNSYYRCFIENIDNLKFFLNEINSGVFINNLEECLIFLETGSYNVVKKNKKKFNIYHQKFINYPFNNPDIFFNKLINDKFTFKKTDSSYLLINSFYLYEFRKSDFSIYKIVNTSYDNINKGIYFYEKIFEQCIYNDTLPRVQINEVLTIIGSGKKEVSVDNKNIIKPVYFDLSILKNSNLKFLNHAPDNFDNKIFFLIFFTKVACLV